MQASFMQYKITWLVTVEYICASLWEYVLIVGLVLTSEWILSAKLYLLWRVFIIHLVNFAKPVCPKSCPHTSLLTFPVCVARFYWSLWMRSQTFVTLVSKSAFLKRGPRPPWGPRNSGGHVQRPSRGHDQRPELGIFTDEQGPQVLRVFWRGPRLMTVWEPLF